MDEELRLALVRSLEETKAAGPPPTSEYAFRELIENFTADKLKGTCTVCGDDFVPKDELKRLPCKHAFHDECILPWLSSHNTCPLCRSELPTSDPIKEQERLDRSRPRTSAPTRSFYI